MDYINIWNFSLSKDTVKRWWKQFTEWEKISSKHILDEGLIFRIFNNSYQSIGKGPTILIEKIGTWCQQWNCIGECLSRQQACEKTINFISSQENANLNYSKIPLQTHKKANMKKAENTNAVEGPGFSSIPSKTMEVSPTILENVLAVPILSERIASPIRNFTLKYICNKGSLLQAYSTIHHQKHALQFSRQCCFNSPQLEITQKPINSKMKKQTVICFHSRWPYSSKEDDSLTYLSSGGYKTMWL